MTFSLLRKRDPAAYNSATRHLRNEVEMITNSLKFNGLGAKQIRKLKRREWVLRGVLDYNLSMSVL